MGLVQVKLTKSFLIGSTNRAAGDVVDVEPGKAAHIVASGAGEFANPTLARSADLHEQLRAGQIQAAEATMAGLLRPAEALDAANRALKARPTSK